MLPAPRGSGRAAGYTLIELLLVFTIIATLSVLSVARLYRTLEQARVGRAIADIRIIQSTIDGDESLPFTLADVGYGNRLDPWGRPYVYHPFQMLNQPGSARRDPFMVPLNAEYDLYSLGRDGQSGTPISDPVSFDDVIRANDGGFIGLASRY